MENALLIGLSRQTVLERQIDVVANGTTEWPMRNQFRAWSKFMTMSM